MPFRVKLESSLVCCAAVMSCKEGRLFQLISETYIFVGTESRLEAPNQKVSVILPALGELVLKSSDGSVGLFRRRILSASSYTVFDMKAPLASFKVQLSSDYAVPVALGRDCCVFNVDRASDSCILVPFSDKKVDSVPRVGNNSTATTEIPLPFGHSSWEVPMSGCNVVMGTKLPLEDEYVQNTTKVHGYSACKSLSCVVFTPPEKPQEMLNTKISRTVSSVSAAAERDKKSEPYTVVSQLVAEPYSQLYLFNDNVYLAWQKNTLADSDVADADPAPLFAVRYAANKNGIVATKRELLASCCTSTPIHLEGQDISFQHMENGSVFTRVVRLGQDHSEIVSNSPGFETNVTKDKFVPVPTLFASGDQGLSVKLTIARMFG